MSEHILINDLEIFRKRMPDSMVAIVVDNGKKIFCYGDLIPKHLAHDISCRKIGAKRLYSEANIMEIFKQNP